MSDAAQMWRTYDEVETRLSAPLSERMISLAELSPGMRVLDIATGRGEPAIRAAHAVSPGGEVVGVDPDASVLALARARADREGVQNLTLRAVPAEALEAPARSFQVATSRWGLMSLRDPVLALGRIHQALVPGGRLVVALWAEPSRVPWAVLPRAVLSRHLEVPERDPNGPGPFRFCDLARTRRELESVGFSVVHTEELEVPVIESSDPAGIVAWARALFSLGPLGGRLSALPLAQQRAFETELAEALEPFRVGPLVRLGGVTRIVVARAERP